MKAGRMQMAAGAIGTLERCLACEAVAQWWGEAPAWPLQHSRDCNVERRFGV